MKTWCSGLDAKRFGQVAGRSAQPGGSSVQLADCVVPTATTVPFLSVHRTIIEKSFQELHTAVSFRYFALSWSGSVNDHQPPSSPAGGLKPQVNGAFRIGSI